MIISSSSSGSSSSGRFRCSSAQSANRRTWGPRTRLAGRVSSSRATRTRPKKANHAMIWPVWLMAPPRSCQPTRRAPDPARKRAAARSGSVLLDEAQIGRAEPARLDVGLVPVRIEQRHAADGVEAVELLGGQGGGGGGGGVPGLVLRVDRRLGPALEPPRSLRRVLAATVLAGEQATGERAPDQHAEALLDRDGDELVLGVAGLQRVVDLLADVGGEPAEIGDPQRLHQLSGGVVGRADVADLPRLHQRVQSRQGLLLRGEAVPLVDLVEVDVIGAEPPQTRLDGAHDVVAGQALVVGAGAHRAADLGRDQALVAVGAEGFAEDLLGQALGVDVGGVDQVDARPQADVDLLPRRLDVEVADRAGPA